MRERRRVPAGAAALAALAGLALGSPRAGTQHHPDHPAPPATAVYQVDSTTRMVRRLEIMAGRIRDNPAMNPYESGARVAFLLRVTPPTESRARGNYLAELAQELLQAGRNEEAIARLQALLDLVAASPDRFPAGYDRVVWETLAVAYLRLGEAENCIDNHNADRCVLPISASGVHTRTRGSTQAIAIFERLLAATPDDLDLTWLLNVAYMTLGRHPQDVPARWLIPPSAFESEYDIKPFTDLAPALGLATTGRAGGSLLEDFDNDGFLDIMASGMGFADQLRYFRNKRDGTFEERTREAGLQGLVDGLNMIHADYDNDGFVDVFVLRGGWLTLGYPNSLLRNNGNGTFDDVTEAAGLLTPTPSQTAAFGDYDNDGDLDLFVGNESGSRAGANPCQLFRNNGDGTFSDVAREAGVDLTAFVKGVVWGDYDNDGRLDLYVSVLRGRNHLFHNDGPDGEGRWRFSDVTERAGVAEPIDSFPAWFWDFDNDGWQDLFISGYRASAGDVAAELLGRPVRAEMPRLYRNNRDGTFTNVAPAVGLNRVLYTMGCNFGDLDNDGWLDFYVGTGDPEFRSLMPNRVFRNAGGRTFQDVTTSGRFGNLQKGHGVSFGDIDHDGDQDLHVVLGGAFEGDVFQNSLLENPGHGNRWITLRLEGARSNRSAIGARIKVVVATDAGDREIHRTVSTGGSFGGSSLREEIGLGRATRIRAVEVRWPASGQAQRFERVALDRAFLIREGEDRLRPIAYPRVTLRRPEQPVVQAPLHSAGGASRLAAWLLPQIGGVFSVVAPCQPGAPPASVPPRSGRCRRRGAPRREANL